MCKSPSNRITNRPNAPPGHYDLLLTLKDNAKETLRQEIKRQLGLVAHRETRVTDVLVLEADPTTGVGLRTSAGGNGTVSYPSWRVAGMRKLAFTNQHVSTLARILEGHLGLPVFDRTGLTANCDVMLEWNAQANPDSEEETIRQAIAAQLGIRLVPSRQPVEVLVVQRARE